MAHTHDEERQVARDLQGEFDAADEKHFAETVLPARKCLHQQVTTALENMDAALSTLHALSSNAGFDVEYESSGQFQDYLTEARRLTVIAKALMPTGADGEYVDRDVRGDAVNALLAGPGIPLK